jgi:hypothetical protein
MKLSTNTIHVIQINICGLVAILIGILGLFTICSCSTTKVIINQNELPDECYSGVKKDSTVKTAWNSKIPNVFTVELDSISEVIIDPRDGSKIAEVWYSNAKQGIKDLCLHCNQTQAQVLIGYMRSNPFAAEWVGVNYRPTEKEPYCDIRCTYGSSINAY